jgi:hypothetical protein
MSNIYNDKLNEITTALGATPEPEPTGNIYVARLEEIRDAVSTLASGSASDPTTTAGDMLVRGGSALDRLPVGSAGQFLGVAGGMPSWQPGLGVNAYGYYSANNWVQFNGSYGLYWPNQTGSHIYPSIATFGTFTLTGTKGGYAGINFNSVQGNSNLMMSTDATICGIYNESYDWRYLWYNGTMFVNKSVYSGNLAEVLDTINVNGSWNNITLLNNWQIVTGSVAQYTKNLLNTVSMRGIVRGGTSLPICQLPVGCRPAVNFAAVVPTDTAGPKTILIETNGYVSADGLYGGYFLDISFRAEQ